MKNSPGDPLRDALSHIQPPPCSDEVRERALALSLAALRDGSRDARPSAAERDAPAAWGGWRWLAAAAACVVALLPWLLSRSPAPKMDDIGKVFGQIEALFKSQLDSVVVTAAGVEVNTSDTPTTTYADQRIRLVVSKAGDTAADVQILTYSGRRVCIHLPAGELCLTPLVTGDGRVMVMTDTQVFVRDSALPLAGYRLHMSPMKEAAL